MTTKFSRRRFLVLTGASLTFGLTACTVGIPTPRAASPTNQVAEVQRPAGWDDASHGNKVDPDYAVVFPQDRVNQLTIKIAADDWTAMQDNMTELFGEKGDGTQTGPGGFPGGPGQPPGGAQDGQRPRDGQMPGGPGGFGPGGPGDMTPENPMWVPATIEFNGKVWNHVGVRYKGNSSLTTGWRQGTPKLPLKLDFDEFENDYPEIDNQRFYGFKQLSLANGFADSSYLRETLSYDILEQAGLPAAETAFYTITLDYGEGALDLGIYTLVEVIDDTVVARVFGDDSGNIYEGDGSAASLAADTFETISEGFLKENNEDEADWSDIEALYTVLHSDLRSSDPAAWRAELEAIFDVDSFLHWLAISAVIQNWDNYGAMTHNFYLYHDPQSGQLKWISWDHNMTMSSGMAGPGGMAGGADMGGGGRGPMRNVSLDKAEITEQWPLIRFLLDQPPYYETYLAYMADTLTGPFAPAAMTEAIQTQAALIADYIPDAETATFDSAVETLLSYVNERAATVRTFLDEQP